MARDAKVHYQKRGHGVIHFAGQREPAIAITAREMARLHYLGKRVALLVKEGDTESPELRGKLQSLQHRLASMLLELTDTAARHDMFLEDRNRIGGCADFVWLEDEESGEC